LRALAIAPVLLLALGAFALWVWTLVDVIQVPGDDRFRAGNQLIWVLVIVFTQVIGSVIYLAIGRPEPHLRR
jgi:hypothetical protein